MRSTDDRHFKAAFFELYLHECLLRMGYSVTCHPELKGTGRRPDFLAQEPSSSIYVEARPASLSDNAVRGSARVTTIYDSLDKLDSPNFFLWIDVVKQGPNPPSVRSLRSRLERWLAALNPDDYSLVNMGREDLPSCVLRSWRLGNPIRRNCQIAGGSRKAGIRPLGIFGGGAACWVEDEDGIRGALADKGSAYGSLGATFIVAVASSSISSDDHDVLGALYGTEVVKFRTPPTGRILSTRGGNLTATGTEALTGITGQYRRFY